MNSTRIIVVGSANQDYLVRVPRAPRPGETTLSTGMTKQPGGKGANQAVAAARLGGDVHLVGAVGRDDDGATMLRGLTTDGVSIDDVHIVDQQPTGLALITVEEDGENSIIVVSGANTTVTADRAERAVSRLARPGALVVVQGELSREVIERSVAAAEASGARAIVNLAPFVDVPAEVLEVADPLVLNETEAGELLGEPLTDPSSALGALERLLGHSRSVVVTLGGEGAVWGARGAGGQSAGERGGEQNAEGADPSSEHTGGHIAAEKVENVVDTTGAGDAFVGALAFALSRGDGLESAVRLGARAGSFAIGGVGAQRSYARAADLGI